MNDYYQLIQRIEKYIDNHLYNDTCGDVLDICAINGSLSDPEKFIKILHEPNRYLLGMIGTLKSRFITSYKGAILAGEIEDVINRIREELTQFESLIDDALEQWEHWKTVEVYKLISHDRDAAIDVLLQQRFYQKIIEFCKFPEADRMNISVKEDEVIGEFTNASEEYKFRNELMFGESHLKELIKKLKPTGYLTKNELCVLVDVLLENDLICRERSRDNKGHARLFTQKYIDELNYKFESIKKTPEYKRSDRDFKEFVEEYVKNKP